MTRYARSKGSKASNERIPEEATSWQTIKQQLKQTADTENQQEANTSTGQHLKSFKLKDDSNSSAQWAEFPQHNKKRKDPEPEKAEKKKKHKIAPTESSDKIEEPDKKEANGTTDKGNNPKNKKKHKKAPTESNNKIEEPNKEEATETTDKGNNPKNRKKHKLDKKLNENPPNAESNENNEIHNSQDQFPNKNFTRGKKFKGGRIEKNKFNNNNKFQQGNKFQKQQTNAERNQFQEYKRRKPDSKVEKIFINGNEIEISYVDGFPVKKADAERLKQLRKTMISKGLPRSEINIALKLERRKAEKALAREKKKVCFNCRQSGHILSECPSLKEGSDAQMTETGICFKCGSTEHTHFECKVIRGDNFKFAQCFICKEQGHISRQCPDNNRGLYPKGGACKVCGDVTHLKKDCPKYQMQQQENTIVAGTITNENIESLEDESQNVVKHKKLQKVVKF